MFAKSAIRCAALLGVALSAVGVACSSFSSDDAPATAPGDGPDATTGDERAPPPTLDGGDAGDAGSFCSRFADASFCFSFDDGPDPRIGTKLSLVAPPAPGLTDAAMSAPNALALDFQGDGSAGVPVPGTASGVQLQIMSAGTHAHCDFALWADQLEPDASATRANVDIIYVTMMPGGRLFDYSLRLNESSPTLEAQTGIPGPHNMIANISRASWHAAGFDLQVADGGVLVSGTADGARSAPTLTSGGPKVTNLGSFTMLFGESFVTGHWTVRIDNIVCTWN